jgi:hypothetical protein
VIALQVALSYGNQNIARGVGITIELLTGRNPSMYEYIEVGLGSNGQSSYDALHLNC